MKKRKNVILSAITCFVSICMLMLGVYAASSPSVSIGGQVSYTARDASVLVQGKTSNDGTEIAFTKSAPASKDALLALDKTKDKVNKSANGDTPAEYFDWTQGEKSGNSSDTNETLSAWDIGTISFKESNTGIQEIKVKFLFTNYSNYPVTATLTFDKTIAEMTAANVTRTEQNKVITKELGIAGSATASATVEITYAVKDDSKGVDATGLLGMSIAFEKTEQKATLKFEWLNQLNASSFNEYFNLFVADDNVLIFSEYGISEDDFDRTLKLPYNSDLTITVHCAEDCGPIADGWSFEFLDENGSALDAQRYTISDGETPSASETGSVSSQYRLVWMKYVITWKNFVGGTFKILGYV